jgi:ferric-dicitrate binding protein FerR (iron transport regulator)
MEAAKYENYKTEDFVLDREFLTWVLTPDKEQDFFWKTYLSKHPEKSEQISEAALIIKSLQPDEPAIPEQRLREILQKAVKPKKIRLLNFYRLSKYAAAFILLVGIGSLIWISVQEKSNFPSAVVDNNLRKGKIILSNGTTREFNTRQTVIKQTDPEDLTINSDTIKIEEKKGKLPEAAMNLIINPYGQQSEITLSDGTHIWLNSGSQLSYPSKFKEDSREVYLTGEAFFDVRSDASRPFFVNTKDFKIKVLGTRFNVCAYNNDRTIQAVLQRGKISAGRNSLFANTVDLLPGERLVFDKESKELTKDKVNVLLYTSWINGYLLFENEPTTEVIKKLERHYAQKIKSGTGLDKITFSGKLDLKNDLSKVLENISFASSLEVSEENETLIIKRTAYDIKQNSPAN